MSPATEVEKFWPTGTERTNSMQRTCRYVLTGISLRKNRKTESAQFVRLDCLSGEEERKRGERELVR